MRRKRLAYFIVSITGSLVIAKQGAQVNHISGRSLLLTICSLLPSWTTSVASPFLHLWADASFHDGQSRSGISIVATVGKGSHSTFQKSSYELSCVEADPLGVLTINHHGKTS